MFSRGSLEGFSSSLNISVRVISPIPSSSESFFFSLSVILLESKLAPALFMPAPAESAPLEPLPPATPFAPFAPLPLAPLPTTPFAPLPLAPLPAAPLALPLLSSGTSTTARLLPARAAARAAPMAVLVFLITTCLGFFCGRGLSSTGATGFSRTALAAFF